MLIGWPLKTPPQIGADGTTLALTTGEQAVNLPTRADGSRAQFIILTWEGASPLSVRARTGEQGVWLHEHGQPYLFAVFGAPSLYAALQSGTGTLHVTPVEEA